MVKIFQKANEKYVNSVVIYADSSKDLFTDSAKTKGIKTADLKNLFEKNLVLINDGTNLIRPTKYTAGKVVVGSDTYSASDAE